MKKVNLSRLLVTLSIIFIVGAVSCDDITITGWSGPADLTITNLTTGESYRNVSTVSINLGGASNENEVIFHRSDVLQLKFTPPKEYKKRKFQVEFQVLDVVINVTESPYTYEIAIPGDTPVGSYVAFCSAMCEDWTEGSSCKQHIAFRIEN